MAFNKLHSIFNDNHCHLILGSHSFNYFGLFIQKDLTFFTKIILQLTMARAQGQKSFWDAMVRLKNSIKTDMQQNTLFKVTFSTRGGEN